MLWTKDGILAWLDKSDRFVTHALLGLLDRQTADELASGHTIAHNGQGFNGVDAPLMTKFGQWCVENHTDLTPKMASVARRKLRKYVGQIVEIANSRNPYMGVA